MNGGTANGAAAQGMQVNTGYVNGVGSQGIAANGVDPARAANISLSIPGVVKHVRGYGERKKGDMTYAVTIEPGVGDGRVKWNMTASVRISRK